MRSYSKGLLLGSYFVNKGVVGPVRMNGTAISVDRTQSDPVENKRMKPRADQLIWSGTSYSKSFSQAVHTQLEYESDVSGKGDWSSFYHYWKSSASVCGNSSQNPTTPVDPMNKLLGKLRNDVANIATMLGEYRDTSRLVLDVGTTILKSARLAKRGNITGAINTLGLVIPTRTVKRKGKSSQKVDYPAAWLQYKLGLKPLVEDINLAVGTLTGALQRPAPPIQRVSTSSRSWIHSHKEESLDRWKTVKAETTRQLIAYVQIDNAQLKTLSDHGLTNPLALFWELTWLSFVVDYVFNVSEWLQALDQPYMFTKSICYETLRTRKTVESIAVGGAGLGERKEIRLFGTPKSTYTSSSTSRTIRNLSAVTPQWKPSGGFQRLVTLSALAVSIGR